MEYRRWLSAWLFKTKQKIDESLNKSNCLKPLPNDVVVAGPIVEDRPALISAYHGYAAAGCSKKHPAKTIASRGIYEVAEKSCTFPGISCTALRERDFTDQFSLHISIQSDSTQSPLRLDDLDAIRRFNNEPESLVRISWTETSPPLCKSVSILI